MIDRVQDDGVQCERDRMDSVLISITTLRPGGATPAMRIAQLVVAPVVHVMWSPTDALPETSRGGGGFGHTGRYTRRSLVSSIRRE